jgi:hypothetical protein
MGPPGARPGPEDRLAELGRQIERLRREVEELRRELRRKETGR